MKLAVNNAELNESLLTMHGTAHAKESETKFNVESIATKEKEVVTVMKEIKTRRRILEQSKKDTLVSALKKTSDTEQKVDQASSSFVVLLKAGKNSTDQLVQLASRGSAAVENLKSLSDHVDIVDHVKDLLQLLNEKKSCVRTAKHNRRDLKNRQDALAQTLHNTDTKMRQAQSTEKECFKELSSLIVATDEKVLKLTAHQAQVTQQEAEYIASAQEYDAALSSLGTKESHVEVAKNNTEREKKNFSKELEDSKALWSKSQQTAEHLETETNLLVKKVDTAKQDLKVLQDETSKRAVQSQKIEPESYFHFNDSIGTPIRYCGRGRGC